VIHPLGANSEKIRRLKAEKLVYDGVVKNMRRKADFRRELCL